MELNAYGIVAFYNFPYISNGKTIWWQANIILKRGQNIEGIRIWMHAEFLHPLASKSIHTQTITLPVIIHERME